MDEGEFYYKDCYVSNIKMSLKVQKDAGKPR